MKAQLRRRQRANSIPLVPPPITSEDYNFELAKLGSTILYKSPLPSSNDLPIYILDSSALPDPEEISYDALFPYVLAQLPAEDELTYSPGYELIFFAGGDPSLSKDKRRRPSWQWIMQAYSVLTRALRKKLQKLYFVHERTWIRMLTAAFSTLVSPKLTQRDKLVHVRSLTKLALKLSIEDLLIHPLVYEADRNRSPQISVPYNHGKRAFGMSTPLPKNSDGTVRLPRVLREATSFLFTKDNMKTEGLFRVPAKATTLNILKEAYDRGQKWIVWKENDVIYAPSVYREGHGEVHLDATQTTSGYSITAATGLIQGWYADLQKPIFPESSYAALTQALTVDDEAFLGSAIHLLEDTSVGSIIPQTSVEILKLHLLPLLSAISRHNEENKMTAANLAICFAPSLTRGTDPMQEMKMLKLVQKLLTTWIENWQGIIAPVFQESEEMFATRLRTPEAIVDREDPQEHDNPTHRDRAKSDLSINKDQIHLSEISSNEEEIPSPESTPDSETPPELPPRISEYIYPTSGTQLPIRRKPVQQTENLPQYSLTDEGATAQDTGRPRSATTGSLMKIPRKLLPT